MNVDLVVLVKVTVNTTTDCTNEVPVNVVSLIDNHNENAGGGLYR